MSIDLDSFKPANAGELLQGILDYVAPIAEGDWEKAVPELKGYLETVAQAAFLTTTQLAAGKITKEQADLAFHMQELSLNQILLYSKVLAYVTAQKVLNGVFQVIISAVKNTTGVELSWLLT